jgi:hypothetical protein
MLPRPNRIIPITNQTQGYFSLLSNCMLGMEHQRLGFQIWGSRLRWRRACRNRLWSFSPCVFHGSRKEARKDDAQLPATQCVTRYSRHNSALVWMARIQRWFGIRCQFACGYGVLEFLLGCYVWCCDVVYLGLPSCEEMVYGRMVLGLYLWSSRCNSSFRIYPTLGSHHSWSRHCCNC